ncbi:putative F-box protein PP2-B12 [Andrographis paniculata]|uniref:putative F-box protein PP2-B12 n=1 Tax=Andrographis paniculata TaxID=175694 RepID=UPI0021E797BF|nr:putative F-box protein PP2-B12 [Andrographis paniculata]
MAVEMEISGDICALPEHCIANALSLTSPKDVCRLSAVASTFRSASESDTVWERFLPSDYRDILSRAVDGSDSLVDRFDLKKDLYLHLCDNPVLIDGGRKSFSLDKTSGKKCFMLSARELYIVWGDTPAYWKWISHPESRFSEVAELIDVCWLEIRAKISIDMLSPGTNYAAYFVFNSASRMYGFEQIPAEASLEVNGHESEKRSVSLDPEGSQRQRNQIVPRRMGWFYHRLPRIQPYQRHHHETSAATSSNEEEEEDRMIYPRRRDNDGWMEVELGEFLVHGSENGDLKLSLMEVKGANWKSGIIVEGIEIRPKKSAKNSSQ